MAASKEDNPFERLVQSMDPQSKLVRTWPLQGGISAQVTAIKMVRPDGETQRMIVRQHGERDRKRNPHIAADEFKLLQMLQSSGVAAPAPIYLPAREIFSRPAIVMEYIEGEPEFAPNDLEGFLFQFATQLVKIHCVDRSSLSFLSPFGKGFGERPATLDESMHEGQIRDALESIWPVSPLNEPVLLHGDFWPGNLLWKDGRLVAVIDWEDATLGDPLADVANSRLEILWAFGSSAMERFTALYQSMTSINFTNLPYWDLCAALRPASKIKEWGLDAMPEKTMRERHEWFITQAFEKESDI